MSANDPLALSHRYFQAWRDRDARAVLATLAPGGTYEDPVTTAPLSGDALAGYMQGLWAAFPDLDFDLGEVHRVADDTAHGAWTMRGVNHGSFQGLPPTGRTVSVPGIDVIRVGPDGIRSVRGYFDAGAVPRQLGLDIVVQPRGIGPFQFGTSILVRRPDPVQPGVLVFTELMAASDETVPRIRDQSRQIVTEHLDDPSFLGFTSSVVGRRMTTVSAWASADTMHRAMASGSHAAAMRNFGEVAEAGWTAVYAPVRTGPWLRRCDACGTMARFDGHEGRCRQCGATVRALA